MKNKYDVIIIGAGIGGLVCGCYLARKGVKCIILERLKKPGGYCSSFSKDGFIFDAGPHSFGSCREKGQIGKLIKKMKLGSKVKFEKKEISNIVMAPNREVVFYSDTQRTSNNLKESFPKEAKNIDSFFDILMNKNVIELHAQLKNRTFQEVLDKYFDNNEIKSILGLLVGNLGLSPQRTAAFTAAILYREHIFDGGYYPKGGTQAFSDSLAERFQELGGDISYLSEVEAIIVKDKKAKGITTKDGKSIEAQYVVSNCDAVHTYSKLLGGSESIGGFDSKIKKLEPSPSFFVVHVGLNEPIRDRLVSCSTLWEFESYNMEKIHKDVENGIISHHANYIVVGFPYQESKENETRVLTLIVLAPYKDAAEWKECKDNLKEILVRQTSKILPDIAGKISTFCVNTPHDFYNYTYNRNGSISGWASTPEQVSSNLIGMQSCVSNLFHVGHWVTSPGGQGGIPMVVYSGKITAKFLLSLI